jgi:methylthioribose-1-phosphate isomerase
MAPYFISEGIIDAVVVGADRIAANGDAANKIGTLGLSIIAKYYSIPFYVAAPTSTIDLNIKLGTDIPIEMRPEKEVREVLGKKILLDDMPVKNPAFDVTTNDNITAIITEKKVLYPPFETSIKDVF